MRYWGTTACTYLPYRFVGSMLPGGCGMLWIVGGHMAEKWLPLINNWALATLLGW